MATYTTLSILNHSLLLCGASPVTSLTEDSVNGRALNIVYENARKSFLTECKWNATVTRTTLATVATTTIAWFHSEEGYVYSRPSGALRIWEFSNDHSIVREEGEYLIADTAGLGVKYTYDHSEVGLWRPKMIEAFIDKLCSDISFTIINSSTKAEAFLAKYQKVSLPNAMSDNAQTGFQQRVIDDEWESAKLTNGGNPSRSYS